MKEQDDTTTLNLIVFLLDVLIWDNRMDRKSQIMAKTKVCTF